MVTVYNGVTDNRRGAGFGRNNPLPWSFKEIHGFY